MWWYSQTRLKDIYSDFHWFFFERLQKANLKLKPEKCRLFQRKIHFLGHVVSAAGVEPDQSKVQTVLEWPTPRTLTEVRAFVALASYYRRHIAKFADIAKPLHELTQKGHAFCWTDRQQKAFVKLKECLLNAPVLDTPIDGGRYVLDTDASDFALGAVLHQQQGEHLRVIAYASRSLQRPERSYSTTRKELLGIVYGLKYFRQFLLGRNSSSGQITLPSRLCYELRNQSANRPDG